ncbi:hypothetical protein HDU98_002186, partial [Podochytrium sp. JEL0797]
MGAPPINQYKVPLAILRIFASCTGGVLQFLILANTHDSDLLGLVTGTLTALLLFLLPVIFGALVPSAIGNGALAG